ncbi:VirB2 family type IV secretion system major pilin TrwL [Bartonella doshiae]|uniref:VirB2 family type IV secretion system major pilin TrwL n=1 Tax=Bartonella doshiae TaxID=33044 RepID=UPI000943139D|nr:VirB2 family type IV secretion system major pilin TrwL [Bartonella doshiae]
MKQLKILPTTVHNKIIATAATLTMFFMTHPAYAQLTNAKGVLEKFRDQLKIIVPIAATVILLGLAIGYAGRYIEKDTFIRWAIGVIVAGSAAELANLLFTK